MDDNEFDNTLKKLNEQVGKFTGNNPVKNMYHSEKNSPINFDVKSPYLRYGLIPVVILCILGMMKPGVVVDEVNVDGIISRKINMKKLLVATGILSIMIFFAIFLVKKRSNNKIDL